MFCIIGHVLYRISKSKCLCTGLGCLVMALNGFRVLLFVPTAQKVLAETKTTLYTERFALSFSD